MTNFSKWLQLINDTKNSNGMHMYSSFAFTLRSSPLIPSFACHIKIKTVVVWKKI